MKLREKNNALQTENAHERQASERVLLSQGKVESSRASLTQQLTQISKAQLKAVAERDELTQLLERERRGRAAISEELQVQKAQCVRGRGAFATAPTLLLLLLRLPPSSNCYSY